MGWSTNYNSKKHKIHCRKNPLQNQITNQTEYKTTTRGQDRIRWWSRVIEDSIFHCESVPFFSILFSVYSSIIFLFLYVIVSIHWHPLLKRKEEMVFIDIHTSAPWWPSRIDIIFVYIQKLRNNIWTNPYSIRLLNINHGKHYHSNCGSFARSLCCPPC